MKSPEERQAHRALAKDAREKGLSLANEGFNKIKAQAQEAVRGIKETIPISQGPQSEVAPLPTSSPPRAATQQRGVPQR
jgi:hypothetical protein